MAGPFGYTVAPVEESNMCHLMNLPAELCNCIYTLAIVEPEDIEITETGPGEPALLQTCKGIREYAIGIYYLGNVFDLQIVDWNGLRLLPFMTKYRQQLKKHRREAARQLGFPNLWTMHGRADWSNMIAWVKSNFDGDCIFPLIDRVDDSEDQTAKAIQEMVDKMQGVPWATIEVALEGMYNALRATDSRWVKTEDRILW